MHSEISCVCVREREKSTRITTSSDVDRQSIITVNYGDQIESHGIKRIAHVRNYPLLSMWLGNLFQLKNYAFHFQAMQQCIYTQNPKPSRISKIPAKHKHLTFPKLQQVRYKNWNTLTNSLLPTSKHKKEQSKLAHKTIVPEIKPLPLPNHFQFQHFQ